MNKTGQYRHGSNQFLFHHYDIQISVKKTTKQVFLKNNWRRVSSVHYQAISYTDHSDLKSK